ncbi:16S rRNA (adenine(1518)-N(6)/adenine(1519)-N(6))-dimethyltransferase RsmA [Amorphus coralli]|uniref:16S rRNA (adenine(1518)-N(6)/adenine(1519)-N(6))- dimethyltransferase RsmA n=1 Tax=Amorphus coralli TaxID=340680 RepID=UPI0003F4ADDF|nr:16S rRNA (adenine(1518)-N(6)/adenine(1519)-N(6))-dimethyltransferase RsmA [Amorphus coralli]
MPDDPLPPLRDVIRDHGLSARKSLGQNFLLDLNLTRRIARTAGDLSQMTVIEVGPGPGGLTRALLMEGAAKVVAVERDRRCIAALEEVAAAWPGQLDIIEGDALEVDLASYLEGRPGAVVANLPYNVGTALLVGWLETEPWPPWWQSLTLMFQREVAERLVAAPGTSAYGRLAVLTGWRADARIMFDVTPKAFTPPPKVWSSVVNLAPRAEPLPCNGRILSRVTAAAFGQRRKMLRQSLRTLGGDTSALIEAAGLDPTQRAETVTVEEFVTLARAVEADGS